MKLVLLASLFLSAPLLASRSDKCACVTRTSPSGLTCSLAPASGQRAVIGRLVPKGKVCDEAMCKSLYEAHRKKARPSTDPKPFYAITCDSFKANPEYVEDAVACVPKKPVMIQMSLTPEFDEESSVNVPPPYQPVRLDVNSCSITGIGTTLNTYIAAIKNKKCGCDSMVFNINSHGDGTGAKHITECREAVDEDNQKVVKMNSRQLVLELQKQIQANGCKNSVISIDNCFSSKILEEIVGDDLPFPVVTSADKNCVAPGKSNLWTDYQKWCDRCDKNGDGELTVIEVKTCIPTGGPRFQSVAVNRITGKTLYMSFVDGPWGITFSKKHNTAAPVFLCDVKKSKASSNFQGLGGREKVEEFLDNETHGIKLK